MLYSLALFFHVLAAIGMFAALGIEWTTLRNLARATSGEEARDWLGHFAILRRLYPLSFVTILVTGVYMMTLAWGGEPWIAVGLLGMLALPAIAGVMTARRVRRIGPELGESVELDGSLKARLADSALQRSHRLRAGLAVGIVFLMTVKPGWVGSLAAILAFTALGGLVGRVERRKTARPVGATAEFS